MSAGAWVNDHRKSILFLLAVLIAGGIVASLRMPVSLFPRIFFPRVRVSLEAGDRPADRMMMEATRPAEEAVRSVPGVLKVLSVTSRGSAEIDINFAWGLDMISATLQVQAALNAISPQLPQGTSTSVRMMDPTVYPVLAYSLTSEAESLVTLRDMALYQLAPRLSAVSGVAAVGVQGGDIEEYQVIINPMRVAAYGMSVDEVAKALSASNVVSAVGRMEDNYKLYLVVSDTRLIDLSQIGRTVVRSGSNGIVTLGDIGTVRRATAPQWTRVTSGGHDAVIFQVLQQPGGNTVSIGRRIKAVLGEIRKTMAAHVKIATWYDQTDLILSSVSGVRDAILIGIVLAALILLIFLGSWRITLIALICVPSVLTATLLLLFALDQSINIMTLGGMAAAVGLIIDDTIVMVEHIMRRMEERANPKGKLLAAYELTKPLAGSSASTIVIFLPPAFLSGVTGAFFKALSLTMAASLFISFFFALLVVPLLSNRLIRAHKEGKRAGRVGARVREGYGTLMESMVRHRILVLLALLVLIAAGALSYRHIGSGFLPPMDEGGFVIDYRSPPGTSLTETDRLLRQVEAILMSTPDVETYSRRTGLQLGGGVTEANQGDFFVKLKTFPRRPIEEVMEEVRKAVEERVPGLEIELAQLLEDLIGDLAGTPEPVRINIYSDDGDLLSRLGPRVADAIGKVRGVVDVRDGIVVAGDALDIRVDRVKASHEGVDPESVTGMVAAYMSGIVTTQIQKEPKMIGVRVWVPTDARASRNDVREVRLRAPDGHYFPVKRVAALTYASGQPEITREDLKRMIAVTGRISGRDLGSVIGEVRSVLERPGLIPTGVYYELGGLYAQQQTAFVGLIAVFVSAVLLVFALLLFLYNSFSLALGIMVTTLLSVPAVFIGLAITGQELNISSMMGMTMIIGIVTEASIFYVSEYVELRTGRGHSLHDLIDAGNNRMRPIAMTTVAAILALLPLALSIGRGSAMQQPLAVAIISGLVVHLPLLMIVLPVLLTFKGVGRADE